MKKAKQLSMALLFAAVVLPASPIGAAGSASGRPEDGWHRFTSPNGRISIDLPCDPTEMKTLSSNAGFAIECEYNTLEVSLSQGVKLSEPFNRARWSYKQHLGNSKKFSRPGEIRYLNGLGVPAFSDEECGQGSPSCFVAIDDFPRKPIILTTTPSVFTVSKSDMNSRGELKRLNDELAAAVARIVASIRINRQ